MSTKDNIAELLENYGLENQSIFVCRPDGIPLYFQKKHLVAHADENSVGALIGGIWQAARSLTSFIPTDISEKDFFRLSFDTSSRGIYLLPLGLDGEEYYLGFIYYDLVNPALLKKKLRLLTTQLIEILKVSKNANTEHSDIKGDYLFKDILDSEMDALFRTLKS